MIITYTLTESFDTTTGQIIQNWVYSGDKSGTYIGSKIDFLNMLKDLT